MHWFIEEYHHTSKVSRTLLKKPQSLICPAFSICPTCFNHILLLLLHRIHDFRTIHILRQQKYWVVGSRKSLVLLTFNTVFMLTWVLYICLGFGLLAHLPRDLSQADMGTCAVVRVIEQCCFNSVPAPFNCQTVNLILKPPKVILPHLCKKGGWEEITVLTSCWQNDNYFLPKWQFQQFWGPQWAGGGKGVVRKKIKIMLT